MAVFDLEGLTPTGAREIDGWLIDGYPGERVDRAIDEPHFTRAGVDSVQGLAEADAFERPEIGGAELERVDNRAISWGRSHGQPSFGGADAIEPGQFAVGAKLQNIAVL